MKFLRLFLIILLVTPCLHAMDVLRVGATNYPPLFEIKGDEAKGSLVVRLEKKLGKHFRLKWIKIPLNRGEYALNNELIDVFAGYVKGHEFTKDIDYSASPYYVVQPYLCSLNVKDKPSMANVAGKRMVFPKANKVVKFISDAAPDLVRVSYGNNYTESAIKMLQKGRADYMMAMDKPSMATYEKRLKELTCAEVGKPLPLHLTFKKGSKLKAKIDKIDLGFDK